MLLAQTHRAHEVIVVDQTPAPEGTTRARLAGWHEQGAIRWLRQAEPNASKARNTGALAATGDALLFLDDDIRVKPDFLAAYAETFARTGALGVSGQVLEGDGGTVEELPAKAFDREIGWLHFRKNYSKECLTGFMMSGNAAVRRKVFLELGGMDENYERGAFREESDFAVRFVRAGNQFVFQPLATIYHLGAGGIPQGGSRTARGTSRFWFKHHLAGDWYFILRWATWRTLPSLLLHGAFRSYVCNRSNLRRPLVLLAGAGLWAGAFCIALWRRLGGAKYLTPPVACET